MTLKQVLKVLSESKYLVISKDVKTGEYDYITINYQEADNSKFFKQLIKRERIEKSKNKITFISYNAAAGMIEIDVEVKEWRDKK